jgi:uncharacterized protein with HEPN domain
LKRCCLTQSFSFEQFKEDSKTVDAVLHNIQILGEASFQIPKDFREQNTQVEWGKITRSRHILVHHYHQVDYEIIWKIIEVYLSPLKTDLEKLISNMETE